jgi:TolB-like protein/DNA-binding winged helix-turn-helix (wHTH) protein/lipopolysaccharide biosynthesis regulator YciM
LNEVAPSRGVIRFSAYEVDFRKGEVRKHGFRIRLQDQPFHILQILLEHHGELVSREELQRQVWPADTFVDFEKGLNNAVKKLRDALGDSAEQPRFIETHARRGYSFIGSVTATNGAGRKEDATSTGEVGALGRPRALYRRLVIGGVLFLAFVATLFGFDIGGVREHWLTRASSPAIHSLAVIPLANLSNDPNQEYFSDGMTDALITDLAQIGSVKVISRTSSMQYKQTKKSLPEIARELNVDGIVEGTVQRAGDRLRISAQLIHAASDKHLWAKSYEGDMRDVFALERDVTADIARQVQARLTTPNQAEVAQFRPVNPKALDLYLQGNYHLNGFAKGAGDEEKRKAAEYFQQAIDAEPKFASAYNGLANAHLGLLWPSKQDAEIATEAAERAVALDPNSSDAHITLGGIKESLWNWAGAEEEYERAIALNPNSADAHGSLGGLLDNMGRLDEGWKELQIAFQLDPNNANLFNFTLSCGLERRGEFDRAIAIYQMFLKRDPNDGFTHLGLARDYMGMGMYKEAMPHLEQFWALFGFPEVAAEVHSALATSGYRGAILQSAKALEHLMATHKGFGPVTTAEFYATVGDKERAFYWLERAYGLHDTAIAGTDDPLGSIEVDPQFEPLRSDPRFKDLIRRMGLPELRVNESRASGQRNGHN